MRELIYTALLGAPAVSEKFDARIYQWGSLGHNGVPARPDFMFLLIMEQPANAYREVRDTSPGSQKRNFQFMAYDELGGGYVGIEQGLYVVRDTLIGLVGQTSPSGARCTDAVWTGISVDSKDVDYEANVKWSTMSFVAAQ